MTLTPHAPRVPADTLRTAGIPLLVAAAVAGGPAAAAHAAELAVHADEPARAGADRAPTAQILIDGPGYPLRRFRARPVVHVVRPGDTVWAIAHRFGVPVRSVLQANNLDSTALIHPGRKLVLPGARATGSRHRIASQPRNRLRGSRARINPASGLPATAPPPRSYPRTVRAAAAANREALAWRAVPSRTEARALVKATAERYHLDPAVALAVATMESGFDQRQVSDANAIGTMQVLPSTGAWISQLVGRPLDLLDAEDNVTTGVVLLTVLQAQAGDEATALAGYYQGLGSVRKHGMYPDTRRYVASARTIAARLR